MISLRDASLLTQAGLLAVLAVAFASFLGLLGLRFQRRGGARFWASPAALALCLLPAAVAAVFASLALRETLSGLALTGAGGVAAIAAGTAEALAPLLVGLVAAALLAACAFLATAIGSSRSSAPDSAGPKGWALLTSALLALVLLCGVVGLVLGMGAALNAVSAQTPQWLALRLSGALLGSIALVVLTFALALVAAFVAPRGSSGAGIKVASLAALALCGVVAALGLWATWTRSSHLMETAITGVPEGELPEPVQMDAVEVQAPPPPPPPPPPARRASESTRSSPGRIESPEKAPFSGVAALRVGGEIREPRKIKHVNPSYPDIARQARVQGVVILEATISPQGRVTSVRVLRGIPLLDQAAIEAVRQWVYEPTRLNGVPVPVIMTVTVNYKLGPG